MLGHPQHSDPGCKVDHLSVIENLQGGWVEIAGPIWDISKLKAYLKKDMCLPCCITGTRQKVIDTVCPHSDQPGHIRGGDDTLHRIKRADREHFTSNFKLVGLYVPGARTFSNKRTRDGGQIIQEQLMLEQDQLQPNLSNMGND